MANFFKTLGKGILYVFGLPLLIIFLAVYLVISIFGFIIVGIKNLILFFKGENLHGKIPEDVEAEKRLDMWLNPVPHIMDQMAEIKQQQIDMQKQLANRQEPLMINQENNNKNIIESPVIEKPSNDDIFKPIEEIDDQDLPNIDLDDKEDN